jgi:hypothetical protein
MFMSHRLALLLSVTLTVVLAAGVLASRDRFFAAASAPATVATTPAPAVSGASLPVAPETNHTGATPRIIEIPMPTVDQRRADEDGLNRDHLDSDEGDHERDHHDDDDEGEHDD